MQSCLQVDCIGLVKRMEKGSKKSYKKKGTDMGKEDLSKVMCPQCHNRGHYPRQCPSKKKGKAKQHIHDASITGDVVGMDGPLF